MGKLLKSISWLLKKFGIQGLFTKSKNLPTLSGKFGQKSQNCLFNVKFGNYIQFEYVEFGDDVHFSFFGLKTTSFAQLCSKKSKLSVFKMKLDKTESKSYICFG